MTAINRPLNDEERELLGWLTVWNVMRQVGCTDVEAAAALDRFAETGEALRRIDAHEVTVEVAGHVLVRAERDWLAFYATRPDELPAALELLED